MKHADGRQKVQTLLDSLPSKVKQFFATSKFLYEFKNIWTNQWKKSPLSFGSGNPERQMTRGWYNIPVLNAFPVLIL